MNSISGGSFTGRLSIPRRNLVLMGGAAAVSLLGQKRETKAQSPKPLRIGVLTDMTGTYSPNAGQGSVVAVRMAVEDVGSLPGGAVEILVADHQNKPDVGSTIAREWFDVRGVDCIIDVPNSAVALAVMGIARERNKVVLVTGSASSEISGKSCMPTALQWTFDTIQWANTIAAALVARGGSSWFFITPDYTFGLATENDISAKVRALGGSILGSARYPLGAMDFAQYILQAQQSQAKVLVLGSAGTDLINVIKQANEFGLMDSGMMITGLLQPTDVAALGLATARGIFAPTAFDPNRNAATIAWTDRFSRAMRGAMPAMTHAGTYSAARHYLQAIKDSGTVESGAVVALMRATPVNDIFVAHGTIREDGLLVHDWYMQEVKQPTESKGAHDLFKTVATVSGSEALRPLSQSTCPLVKT